MAEYLKNSKPEAEKAAEDAKVRNRREHIG